MEAIDVGGARVPRALLLTAGLGTRLRPLTNTRAKAAVPVNGEPLVRRIIRWLAGQGVRALVLNLHHRPATIAAVVGDGADLGVAVRYSWEQPVLGSAGGPRHALPLLVERDDDHILLVNGDTLTSLDVAALLEHHRATRAAVTMALIPNPRPDRYGGVQVSPDGWVTGFTRRGAPGPSFHFIGVQAARGSVFAALPDNTPSETVGGLYPTLIASNPRCLAAFVSDASFQDIGTPRDYLATSLALAAIEGDRLTAGSRSTIAGSARVVRTAVWDDVRIGAGAHLTDCIVGDGVHIPDGGSYSRCAIVKAGTETIRPGERVEHGLLIAEFDTD